MKENGQLDRIWKNYGRDIRQDCVSEEANPLTMNNVIAAFVFLLAGMILVLITLLVEVLVCVKNTGVLDEHTNDKRLCNEEAKGCLETRRETPENLVGEEGGTQTKDNSSMF